MSKQSEATFIDQLAAIASLCADPRDSELVASQMAAWAATNGVTAAPTEPTEEDVDAMARAMAASDFPGSLYEGFHKSWHERFERYARAAHAALMGRYRGGQG